MALGELRPGWSRPPKIDTPGAVAAFDRLGFIL
jgi:hypothetical protein